MASFELWDWDSANLVNVYPSKAAAFAVVASYVRANGREAVESWALLFSVPGKDHEVIAEGDDLAALALHEHPTRISAD